MQLFPDRPHSYPPFDLALRQRAGLHDPLGLLPQEEGGLEVPSPSSGTGERTFLAMGLLCEWAAQEALGHPVSQSNPPHALSGRNEAQRG